MVSHPSSCASRSHLVTLAPSSEIQVFLFPITIRNLAQSGYNGNRRSCCLWKGLYWTPFHSLFIIWDICFIPFCFPCACLVNLHVPYATYLDSFSDLVFRALVFCVDLQSEYYIIFLPTFSLIYLSKFPLFTFLGILNPFC